MPRQKQFSNKDKEIISRFQYYTQCFAEPQYQTLKNNSVSTKQGMRDIGPSRFFYFAEKRDNFDYFQLITVSMLTQIAKKIYISDNNIQNSKIRKEKLEINNQKPQIVVISSQIERQLINSQQKNTLNQYSSLKYDSQQSSITKPCRIPQKYSVYIKRPISPINQWIYFVTKLTFSNQDNISSVFHQVIIGITKQNGFLNYIFQSYYTEQSKTRIQKVIKNSQKKITILESILAKTLKKTKIQSQNQEKMSHPEFRRQDKLPPSEYKKFQKLKTQTYRYFTQINGNRKINSYSLDNLICRFMKFKQYQYEQTWKAIKNYLNWEKNMRQKYTYEGFEHYHKMRLYDMAGRDYDGRVILLFRPYLIKIEQIKNQEQYIDFTLYMLDLYIEDNSLGYIDDFILIADYQPFGSQNFKLSIAKQVANRSKQLFPDRQYKVICFGFGTFSHFIFRMIKPFLPKELLQKTALLGSDKKQLKQFLHQFMEVDALPAEILGGKQERDKILIQIQQRHK